MTSTPRRALLTAAGASLTAPALGQSQWPPGPIRFIGIFPPGGGTDTISRIWCHKMGEITGKSFVVENRSGSAGNVGTEAIARAVPDGNTIGLASITSLSISPTLYSRLAYDPVKDFSLISGIWQLPNLLVVNNDVPAQSVPELIALLKANPGRYSFASSGSGTTVHLSGELFKLRAGVDMLHVPYRGGAPAHVDVMAGRVHMIFDNIPQALQEAREGKVRALAVTTRERSPMAPEIPALQEFLPDFDISSWGAVQGPAGIPRPIVDRINALSKQALESPDLIARFRDNGATPWHTSPEEFAAYRDAQEAVFAPLIQATGAKVD
jgi:tripartite-type tricarboxylate transporter receptor subunit TctC